MTTLTPNRLDESRNRWGMVFSDFRLACEWVNLARYEVEDMQALKREDVQRLRALIAYAQKEIDEWEVRSK